MNSINFQKYQGTGNDFVMIDDRSETFDSQANTYIARLCDRRFGIGADGLILLRPDKTEGTDFRMIYFNADGHEGSMCGNGGRCVVAFAASLGLIPAKTLFVAADGLHQAQISMLGVSLQMNTPQDVTFGEDYFFMNTGSPHYIVFKTNINKINVVDEGRAIRYEKPYNLNGGTNVNFVEIIDQHSIFVRTYERGVEDETLSCGTGATAAALSFALLQNFKDGSHQVDVKVLGGDLKISFYLKNKQFSEVYLIGKAEKVFEGVIVGEYAGQ